MSDVGSGLADARELDRLRRALSCEYVAARIAGCEFTVVGDRLKAYCPIHEGDGERGAHKPSLHLWSDGTSGVPDRWRCSPCGKGGDVFSLIGFLEAEPAWAKIVEKARELAEFLDPRWAGSRVSRRAPDRAELVREVSEAQERMSWDANYVETFLAHKRLPFRASWLAERWRIGVGGGLVIPHYAADGTLTGAKLRDLTSKASIPGSRFGSLYGSWRDSGRSGVVLCEGESDCWAADAMCGVSSNGTGRDVLGLPAGVKGPSEPWLLALTGRQVWVALDADGVSEPFAEEWVEGLRRRGIAAVRVRPKVGKDLCDHLVAGFGVGDLVIDAADVRPVLDVTTPLENLVLDAWVAVDRANEPPRMFVLGGLPVRIGADGAVQEISPDVLRFESAASARWVRSTVKGGVSSAHPPDNVLRAMLGQRPIPLPRIERVVAMPVFRKDGTLSVEAGYDEETKTYLASKPGAEPLAHVDWPSAADGLALWREMTADFPFVGSADRANALAMFLTPFCVDLFDGPTPLFLIEKPTPGVGATLLAKASMMAALGDEIAVTPPAENDDEWRKRLTAIFLSGGGDAGAVLIDNAVRLDSSALSGAITTGKWQDRVLGGSRIVTLDIRTTWIATGNNPRRTSELTRRTALIRLDANLENPEDRTGFGIPNLPVWAKSNRRRLAAAAYAMIDDWLRAGRIPWTGKAPGSLEEWARCVGGVLERAGSQAFLANREEAREWSDEATDALDDLLEAWWERFGSERTSPTQLAVLGPAINGGLSSQRVGQRLNRKRGQVVGGRKIVGGKSNGVRYWQLIPQDGVEPTL